MTFLLTQRCRLSGPFRYIEHVRKVHQTFSRSLFKNSFSSKHEVLSEYSDLTLSFIFQNLNFSRFSWHIIWLVCRTITFFLLTHKAGLDGLSKYFEHIREVHRKVSIGFWKNCFSSKHEEEMKLKFELKLFSKAPRKFSVDSANMLRVFERYNYTRSLR